MSDGHSEFPKTSQGLSEIFLKRFSCTQWNNVVWATFESRWMMAFPSNEMFWLNVKNRKLLISIKQQVGVKSGQPVGKM